MKQRRELTAIRDIARLYDIRDVLGLHGKKKVIVCPLPQHVHQHRTPSFSIFMTNSGVQKFVCHGSCGQYGDVIDLVGFMNITGYRKNDKEMVKAAISILTGGTAINPPRPEEEKKPTLPNGMWKQFIPAREAVLEYAKERFLTPETLERFHVGQHYSGTTMWMTMPTLHGNQLRGIKMRNLNAQNKKHRYMSIEGSVDGLFNFNGVDSTSESVLIVKGEIAVMTLAQHGILACAPTGGEASYYKHEELLQPLAFARKRVVVGDNDERPKVHEDMVAAAERRKLIFKAEAMYLPPNPFVGIDDWVNAKPEEALPTIKKWME